MLIGDNSFAEAKSYNLKQLNSLSSYEIGNGCFSTIGTFNIDGSKLLESIKIGSNSFTKHKNSYGKDDSRSFRVSNCDKLESIEIGQYSFSDYSGKFELSNTPSLKSLKIGVVGKESVNFYYGSLTLQGNTLWNNTMIS